MKKNYEAPEINVISLISDEAIMETGGTTGANGGSGFIDG